MVRMIPYPAGGGMLVTMPKGKSGARDAPDSLSAAIGERLQALRRQRGFTQKQLAARLGVTREAVAAWEAGRSRLTDAVIVRLAETLNVSADRLLGIRGAENGEFSLSPKWVKRIKIVDGLPDSIKKHILRALDDLIKANTRLSIFNDEP